MTPALSLVCVGDNAQWLSEIASRAKQGSAEPPMPVSWAQFDASPMDYAHPNRWAYAYIDNNAVPLGVRLGRLCRSFPFGVLVEFTLDVHAGDQPLFAHGFQKFNGHDNNMAHNGLERISLSTVERCYRYRLTEYKAVPNWLNARFWAHPERFHL